MQQAQSAAKRLIRRLLRRPAAKPLSAGAGLLTRAHFMS
jgi:hypothetical protein